MQQYPSETDIRQSLISRAEAYCERTGSSLSAIGLAAVNDSKAVTRIKAGENFTVRTYRNLMAWLDGAESEQKRSA